ncbi:hypothetical protein IWW48_002679 [Coemansia sp. RSA 1200]|nr:hypothetical protein IWW48_002679 [Coemansia sp. RSA 1200]
MVIVRSTHTYKPNLWALPGNKTASAAFPTRHFMHAHFDRQHQQQTRGANLITEITPAYVKRLLAELEQERAAKHRANCRIEPLCEEIKCLKEGKSRLENDLDQSQVERSVLEMDLELVREHEMPQMAE